VLLLLLSGR